MERVIQILLVDDDQNGRSEVKRELVKRKILHKMTIAASGEDAMEWMNASLRCGHKPDIIFLNLHTHRLKNGFQFLSQLRTNPEWKDCNVFVLSGHDDPVTRMKVADYNVSGYLVKPLKLVYPSSTDTFHLMVDLANVQYRRQTSDAIPAYKIE